MPVPRKLIPAIAVAFFVSAPAYADVSINIGLPPPVVVLPAPPSMVWLPGPSFYVAFGSPQPIFFISGQYYLHSNGVWYVGPGYSGPWGHIKGKQVPPGLRKFRDGDWRGYQRDAEKHRGNGKTFQARGGKPERGGDRSYGGNDRGKRSGNDGRGNNHGHGNGSDK